jgi:hypothetical protein
MAQLKCEIFTFKSIKFIKIYLFVYLFKKKVE